MSKFLVLVGVVVVVVVESRKLAKLLFRQL